MTEGQPPMIPYLQEHVRAALATDDRVHELGLDVDVVAGRVVLRGAVATEELRQQAGQVAIEVVAGEAADLQVVNDIEVVGLGAAPAEEDLG